MIDDFKPPIKSRSTKDLLLIVGAPKKWNPRALKLAENELNLRKIDRKRIEHAKYIETKKEAFEANKFANESFHFFSLDPSALFINWGEVLMFLFSWEYEKDGFLKKARIQRKYRPIALVMIIVIIIYTFVFSI